MPLTYLVYLSHIIDKSKLKDMKRFNLARKSRVVIVSGQSNSTYLIQD